MIDDEVARELYIQHEIDNREVLQVEYASPPRGIEMWRLFRAIALLKLNGAQKAVLACLVDHANPVTGRCDPGQSRIAGVLGLPKRTVQRAIADLLKTPYLKADRRGKQASNAYHIQWAALLRADEAYNVNRRMWRIGSARSGASVTPEVAHKKEKGIGKQKRKQELPLSGNGMPGSIW